MTPFDWFNVVTQKSEAPDDFSEWNTFMVNRIASMGKNTLWAADEMNKNSGLTSKQVFDFYYHVLPKGKIFNKYAKSGKSDEVIDLLQQVYKISASEARTYSELLTPEDIDRLKEYLFTGGEVKKKEKKGAK